MGEKANDGLLTAIGNALCEDEDVAFAVLFGSQLTGDERASSDVDVAVKFEEGLTATERFQKRCFLSGSLQREDGPFVDITDIETLPIDVAHDAVRGELLCGDRHDFEQFKKAVRTDFERRREDIRTNQRAVIDRIAEDGLHG
ncbi:type VII toxin-antitoxin system MntA family adenylyltransferase antitoxin [Halovivax gelatinilyticus]|uniref:type VII toxin-antitoxin system MntA family adenylyltransferase antitoxin n=1 Tax=Halovivax gelatinilyticus TaxID=2961597 RepID=UPI0020CA3567|nr:nucleotidyltransferase domain-containing protein [Halovivax gelatinilyticus]